MPPSRSFSTSAGPPGRDDLERMLPVAFEQAVASAATAYDAVIARPTPRPNIIVAAPITQTFGATVIPTDARHAAAAPPAMTDRAECRARSHPQM